jgi:hypothetical protein
MVASFEACFMVWATRPAHIPGPFVEQGVVLHYQEWVVVLLQDGSELDGGEGPHHYHVH